MSSAIVSIAPKLSRLIPLLGSDKAGEVVATAAAISRTLKQAGADWHDLTAVLTRAAPPVARAKQRGAAEPWCHIPESERAGWLAKMSASRRLTDWERGFASSIHIQLREWPWRALSEKQERVLDRLVRKIEEARR